MPIEGLLTPMAYGPAGNACYAICLAPPGPSVQDRSRPWPEAELLELRASPGCPRARATAGPRHDPSWHPARQRIPECAGPVGRARHRLGRRRRRWRSRHCSSRLIRRCACLPGAATAASPTMSMRSACCCCAWRSAVRRWRSATTRRSCAASWSSGPTPRWRAMSGCRRSSATWCAACWPRTRSIGRRRLCCSTRQARVAVVLRRDRRGGRSGPSLWRAARSGTRGRWPMPWRWSLSRG